MKNIEYDYVDEVVCPYCGHKSSNSYEYFESGDEDVEIECECGENFLATRNISVTYSTVKKEV